MENIDKTKLLTKVIFNEYPLLILGNLTQNTYSFLTYEDFSSTKCAAAGSFDDLIDSGCETMHDMDKDLFKKTFSRDNLLKEYAAGKDKVALRVFQEGDDGVLRKVEITDFLIKDENSEDVLVISFNKNI